MATSAGTIPINATFNGAQLEKDVLSALNRIQSKSSLNLNTRNFTQPLGKITGLANEFNKSLEASNARVVAFGASAGVIFAVQKSFSALVTSTIEVEKSLIDINIVLNTSAKGIKQFGDQLFEVARSTGSSFKDVAAAATEFSRQGLGLEETLRRTRDALILTRLSGLDVVSSTEALTAAVNSFTREALTTTDVVNKLAAVDAKFAVSSRDLSEALQRVGSSASEAGVSFDELLGIVTSVQQTTARGGAVIGNALKTIFTRIERPQVINDLKDFGVTVTDISGNVLPTIKVIENLAQSFQSLNPVVKSQVAELVGGVYQINILKAALLDVSKQNSAFAEATRASSQAADEAILKNDALNKSLSALINETSANFTQFASAIGSASVAPGIRKVLEAVNKSLSAYNEKDSNGIGEKIATGLLTGLTDFITGPGLVLGGLAVGKLLSNFSKFAGDAAKNILGLNTVGRQQAVLQGEISQILSSNPQLIQQIISGTKTRLQIEKEIKQTMYEQAALSKLLIDAPKDMSRRMIASGTVIDQEGQFKKRGISAGGYIPAQQQAAEKVGAMQGGYTPGKVVAAPKSIGGVMNTAEKVKYIPGFAQPYILPPDGSRAARNLTAKSMSQNGIDPYKSKGFVPNFAGNVLSNPSYGDTDFWLGSGRDRALPLSQVPMPNSRARWSLAKKFYTTEDAEGKPTLFNGNDLKYFIKAGVSYGEIRENIPDSILMTDPRYKAGLRKKDASAITLADIKKDFAPGRKIEGENTIKEGIKQVYDPYIPPASMLVFDLDEKNKEIFADKDTGKIEINRKEGGRAFKIKSYALNASSQNEERTNLISRTADFSRDATKRLAGYIRPGEYSDDSVDEFFKKSGKNYNVLAGTIFEASTNLAANYTRDQAAGGGGDFDVIGGDIRNVRELFPGFADQFGDYKLKNNDEALRSFIGKVKSQFKEEMANHFKEQEIKAGSVTSGLKTSSLGFVPNFAYRINKPVYSKTSTRELTDPETGSYLRYYPGDFYNKETKSQERSLNVSYIRSKKTGQGQEMFDRFSKMARRQKLKSYSDLLVEQSDRVGKIIPKEKYDYLKEKLSAKEIKEYSILEDTSFEDVVKMAYPQLAYRQRGLSKNTKLSLSYRDYAGFLKYEDLSSKDILSQVQNKLKTAYGNDKDSLIQEILHKNIGINDLLDTFSKGHVPNFAYRVAKPEFNRSNAKRKIHDKKTGSYLEYAPGEVDFEKVLKFGFINSYEKGQGHEMFDRYGKIARRSGRRSYSSIILPQTNKIIPKEKYDLLTERQKESRHVLEGLSLGDALKISYPQLMYRERGTSKDSSLSFMKTSTEKSPFEKVTLTGKKIFSSVLDKLTGIYGSDVPEFVKDVEARKIYISELYDTFSKGHIPNFAYRINKPVSSKKSTRELTDPKTGSYLSYYPGEFLNPETNSYEKGLKLSYIESLQKGQGQEMFDRYSKMARRLGVKSYSSNIVPQVDKLKRIIPQKQYDFLDEKSKENHYSLEKTSIEDIVKIAFPQLSYRQKGLSKRTSLQFGKNDYLGRTDRKFLSDKDILSVVQNKIKDLYKNDKQSFIDDVLEGDVEINRLVDTFSKGHIPNFANQDIEILRAIIKINKLNAATNSSRPEKYKAKTPLYRGVGGASERWRSIDKNDPNAVRKAVFSQADYANQIPEYDPKESFMGTSFENLIVTHIGNPLEKRDLLYPASMRKERNMYGFGYERSLPILSTSKSSSVSEDFAGLTGETSSMTVNNSRLLGNESLYQGLYRKYGERKVKEVLFRQSKTGGGRGMGLDFNSIDPDSIYKSEREVGLFSNGYVPNFNPVQEAMGREMAAGYSSSQVKVGQSSKLKTNFNPMGLGVYNSTEGSLNNGIGLAEKAGINPKTKGMSARGHIPNFAETGGADLIISAGALFLFYSSLKDITGELKNYKDSVKAVQKEQISAASSYAQEIGQIPKDFAKKQAAIQGEIEKTFINVDKKLKLTGASTGPLVMGPRKQGSLGLYSSVPEPASPEQVARLDELRKQLSEEKKITKERTNAAVAANKEARDNLTRTQAPIFGKGMFQEGSKFSTLSKTMGPSIGILGAGLANVISEFIPKENKTTKAVVSGFGDVLSSAGAGAAFGPAGLAVGAVYGVYQALNKIKEAEAEKAIDKINDKLEITKQRASDFSGAAENYAASFEGLQNALNDPKAKPETLLKFQKNLATALSSIPDEFRDKVLQAGTDMTKIAEAIAEVNKELGETQKNLQRQLAIAEIIKSSSGTFGAGSVSPKNQKILDALFAASVNPESVNKNFKGDNAAADLNNFFDQLKREATTTKDIVGLSGGIGGMNVGKVGETPYLNKGSAESIKTKLKDKGVLTEEIAGELEKAIGEVNLSAFDSAIEKIRKAALASVDGAKASKILFEIAEVNTKRIIANTEALKALNDQFNDINLQISNQIDIEKNRGKTIREINKIQAEGAVSIQRARVKGALDAFTPFVNEGTKNNIQNQLDVNEINVRQNSQIRDATSKLLDSLSDSITKKVEEARGKIVPAIEGATGTDNIQKQRAVFQRQIDLLTPVVTQGLKDINGGENVSSTRESLRAAIMNNTGTGKAFTTEAADLLIQSLQTSFSEFENKLAEIKAQGDIDIDIQRAQSEYQKQSLALNQRLSFAGGAQALGSTGKSGVSDLFDSLSELVSEFRQTNAIGSAAQKGSSSFKFLDILTNQLQLNRATEAPAGFSDAQSFNKQVSSDLNPLAATAIAGRVQQIRDSLDLAKNVTEIQTGESTQGTALGKAFDMAKEGAVKTALDQISSQFKLENMGNYLDVLQQEARALNALTQEQNDLLGNKLPTSINNNFKNVIQTEVGEKLTKLTESLTGVINKLSVSTQRGSLQTDISNLLPNTIKPEERARLLAKLEDYKSEDFKDVQTPPSSPETVRTPIENDTDLDVAGLEKYIKSFELVTALNERAFALNYNGDVQRGNLIPGPKFREGFTSEVTEEDVKQAIDMQVKFFKAGKQTLTEERAKSIITPIEQRPVQPKYKTYEEESKAISTQFKTPFTSEQLKSLLQKLTEQRNLDSQPPLMPLPTVKPPPSPLQSIIDQYDLLDQRKNTPSLQSIIDQYGLADKQQVSPQLAQARANVDNINKALLARLDDSEELLDLNEKVNALLKEDVASTEKRQELINLQVKLRKKTLEQESKAAEELYKLYYESSYGETFFKDERAAFANAKIENNARQGNVDIGAITEKNTTYNKADFARDTGQLIDTFQTDFKSGIGSAFGEAIKGTKTLKDAFRDMFQGILNRMLDKSLEMGVDALFAFGKAATTGRKDGGLIRGYNSGGMVTGGSGMKDDVPAMMSGGEYVIKKSSVDKYGTDYLRNLNGGAIPRYATGGFSIDPLQNEFLYDNPDRPTSGEFAVDSRLSAMALTDENNPQNKLRQDRYEKLDQYLQDRAQYEAEKKQSLKNYKNQVNSTFYSGLTSAAIQLGTAGLTIGASNLRTSASASAARGLEPGGNLTQGGLNAQYAKNLRAAGGYIAKFAGGGSTGKDNIPALLMGGEYVMNKKAVDMYGKDFMGQLNSGSLPKYANGGMVGTSYNGQTNTDQSSSMDELVTALNALNDNLSKDSGITQSESGRASVAGAAQESGMSVVNNISINMSQGGEVTSEANSSTQKGASNDQNSMQNNGKLAELLRSKVVEVLVEQKRPGGLLYASR